MRHVVVHGAGLRSRSRGGRGRRDRRVRRVGVAHRAARTTGWSRSRVRARPPRWCGCSATSDAALPSIVITGVPASPVDRRRPTPRSCSTSPTSSRSSRPGLPRPRSRCCCHRSGSRPEAEPDAAALALRRRSRTAWPSTAGSCFSAPAGRSAWPHEAALKIREAAGAWTESYPAMEYRHGPIMRRVDRDAGMADRRRRPPPCWTTPRAPGRPSLPIRRSPARLAGTGPARCGRARPAPAASTPTAPST